MDADRRVLSVDTGDDGYEVFVGEGLLDEVGDLLTERIAVRRSPTARHVGLEDTYALVRKAVADHRTIRGRYISFAEGKQIRVTIDPYWLVFHERAWYAIGRSRTHRQTRTNLPYLWIHPCPRIRPCRRIRPCPRIHHQP